MHKVSLIITTKEEKPPPPVPFEGFDETPLLFVHVGLTCCSPDRFNPAKCAEPIAEALKQAGAHNDPLLIEGKKRAGIVAVIPDDPANIEKLSECLPRGACVKAHYGPLRKEVLSSRDMELFFGS